MMRLDYRRRKRRVGDDEGSKDPLDIPYCRPWLQQEVTETAKGRSTILEEDLGNMHYLKAFIKEILRLHPAVPILVPRISTQDVKLNGYDIPTGTRVIVNVWAIGRDHEIWEDPEEFRLERFLNNSIDYNSVNFEWLPFGSGRRKCTGVQFAMAIIELALANLVYKFDFTLPKNMELDMSERYGYGKSSCNWFYVNFRDICSLCNI
ncbi:hypothetical protein LXL04_032192 [Taraxacum kok-saghyz]